MFSKSQELTCLYLPSAETVGLGYHVGHFYVGTGGGAQVLKVLVRQALY